MNELIKCVRKNNEIYVRVNDIQKMLYKEVIRLTEKGKCQTAQYIKSLAKNFDDFRADFP